MSLFSVVFMESEVLERGPAGRTRTRPELAAAESRFAGESGHRASAPDRGGNGNAGIAGGSPAPGPAGPPPATEPPLSHAEPVYDPLELARTGPIHFMGIAGAGMSALAELLLRAGGRVTGCDASPGDVAEHLRGLGAEVVEGHDPDHVAAATAVIATAAVPNDHPELAAARRRGIPVLKRARALGAVVNQGRLLAIAGTHGKTTTTAMTVEILAAAGLDPTGFVGGRVAAWGGGLRAGGHELYVVEADEYDRSFLHLRPEAVAVTSVEADHLDVYGSLEAVENAFAQFVGQVTAGGLVAACVDDPGARRLLHRLGDVVVVTYGTGPDAMLRAVDVELQAQGSRFRVLEADVSLGSFAVGAPGIHNVRNALAAFALARRFGAEAEAARAALAGYRGVDRRFELLADVAGIALVDDYAHHPTEIAATLAAARGAYPGRRLVAAFQPHLYSRTQDFAEAFGRALAAADALFVTDVYAARELPIPGITGELIAESALRAGAALVRYHPAIETLPEALLGFLRPGDACIAMGAGSIDSAARRLAGLLEGRG